MGRAAVDVARELVEQDEERQGLLGSLGPVGEVPAGRLHVQDLEAVADRLVEGVVLGEPLLWTGFQPEGEHVLCSHLGSPSLID